MKAATNSTDLDIVISFEETTLASWTAEYAALRVAAAEASVRIEARNLADRIEAAYLRITGGERSRYIRLAQIRAELGDEDRAAVDAALCGMQQRGGAVLCPCDDPQVLRTVDHAAAMKICGERRDILNIK